MSMITKDYSWIQPGARVELNPATDYWMMGARYASVVSVHPAEKRAKLRMDIRPPGLRENQLVSAAWQDIMSATRGHYSREV